MTPAPAIPAVTPAPGERTGLRDFSDRLSPMLVKELRQGLKSPIFAWGLIAMQAALAIMALVATEEGNSQDVNAAFWWSVTGVVCVLLPMRVANALRDEVSSNTMDTLLLTRLSAWRITLGKWLATGALQVLIAITVLPYLVMRYFAGGVNLPMEAAWLAVFLFFGLVTTAVMLGLSWFRFFLVRAVIMLAVVSGAIGFCAGIIEEISSANRYGLDEMYRVLGWAGISWPLVLLVWAAFFFLDVGASQIAPRSENRSTRRRLVALATFILAGAATFHLPVRGGSMALSVALAALMLIPCVQSLCERPANYPPVLQPFVRHGRAGRLAGRLLYPGWPAGLFFSILLITAGLALVLVHLSRLRPFRRGLGSDHNEIMITFAATAGIAGVAIMPLVVRHLIRWSAQLNARRWALIVGAAAAFHLLVMLTASQTSWSVAVANHLLPSGGLLGPISAEIQAREEFDEAYPDLEYRGLQWHEREARTSELHTRNTLLALVSLASWMTGVVVLALRELRTTRRAEEELIAAARRDL
jgi:hypothetical protein